MSWYPSYQYSTQSPGAYLASLQNYPGSQAQSPANYSSVPSYLQNSSLWQNYSPDRRNYINSIYASGGSLQGVPGAPTAAPGLTADQTWQNELDKVMGLGPTFTPKQTTGTAPTTNPTVPTQGRPGITSSMWDAVNAAQFNQTTAPATNQAPTQSPASTNPFGNVSFAGDLFSRYLQSLSGPAGGTGQYAQTNIPYSIPYSN